MANKEYSDTPDGSVAIVAIAIEPPASPQLDKDVMETTFSTKTDLAKSKSKIKAKTTTFSSTSNGTTTKFETTTVAEEPWDSNTMEITAPESIWNIEPPSPTHPHLLARRSSVIASSFTIPSLNDIKLDMDNTVLSPREPLKSFHSTRISSAAAAATATREINFVLESLTFGIEIQRFNNDPSFIDNVPTSIYSSHFPPPLQQQQQQQQQQPSFFTGFFAIPPSFFTGFFAIPPSLSGRPRLTEEQEQYVLDEFERGPVPLMWSKENLENPPQEDGLQPKSTGSWFSNWWTAPSAVKPAETRREEAMAQ
ncbi:hypothetical protein BGZ65_006863 [Modicella reniformis]|uniref:Uncharacterized protein n=1 Tax=Modicella reniformis TaxID=1440133 RepID=A0A9P6LU29_9FUNG|nr:hypothetical protein BGZ65_006863 [Modicella reniformis]